jgi:hypothetical protein
MKPIVTMTGRDFWSRCGAKNLAENGNNKLAVATSTLFRAMNRLQRLPINANAVLAAVNRKEKKTSNAVRLIHDNPLQMRTSHRFLLSP